MTIDVESLERATLDAVAPLEIIDVDGWSLPMDRSTVGRAISAVPLRHHDLSPESIETIEALYRAKGLRAQFRMPDVAACQNVVLALSQKGYTAVQPTLVQVALSDLHLNGLPTQPVTVSHTPSEYWASVYLASDFDAVDGQHRVSALTRSHVARYAHICVDGQAVASGTASCSHGWVGLHGLRTVMQARGRGHATQIIRALLENIHHGDQSKIYLQVEESNAAASRLYRQLGFNTAWRYHYWKKSV